MTRALCLVAHPDDCVIFGYHYILSHRQHQWSIAYMILDNVSPRVEEMRGYWRRHSIDVHSLELPHDPPLRTSPAAAARSPTIWPKSRSQA